MDGQRVSSAGIADSTLEQITSQNFGHLLDRDFHRLQEEGVLSGGEPGFQPEVALGAGSAAAIVAALWPYVMAWQRDDITTDQLEEAAKRLAAGSGVRLTINLVAAAALGPIYLWFVLARTVAGVTEAAGVKTA